MHQTDAPSDLRSPLASLQRWLFIALITLVIVAGITGLAAVVFSHNVTRLDERILRTVPILAIATILPFVMAALAQRRLIGAWYMRTVLVVAAPIFVLMLDSAWSMYFTRPIMLSLYSLGIALGLSLPPALALQARRAPALCIAALAIVAARFLASMAQIGFGVSTGLSMEMDSLANSLTVAAIAADFACMVLYLDGARSPALLRHATIGAAVVTGVVAALDAYYKANLFAELFTRTAAACFIVTAMLSVSTLIVSCVVLRRRSATDAGIKIELTCPACKVHQTLPTGAANCSHCDCAFSIQITTARCLTCNYALAGLNRGACPECGTPYDQSAPRVPS